MFIMKQNAFRSAVLFLVCTFSWSYSEQMLFTYVAEYFWRAWLEAYFSTNHDKMMWWRKNLHFSYSPCSSVFLVSINPWPFQLLFSRGVNLHRVSDQYRGRRSILVQFTACCLLTLYMSHNWSMFSHFQTDFLCYFFENSGEWGMHLC